MTDAVKNFINSEPVKQEVPAHQAHLPSDGEIAALKAKHGPLALVEVETDDGPKAFVFKQVDTKILSAASKVGGSDNIAAADVMLKNTLVWGDGAILYNDVKAFMAAAGVVEQFNAPYKATLKKI